MDYSLNEEQKLILESAQKFAAEELSFEDRRKKVANGRTLDRDLWSTLAGMGWFGVGIPEERGGFGGGTIETTLIAEALGAGQLLEPYVMCGVFPLRILAADDGHDDVLAAAIAGETLLAVAHSEPQARAGLSDVRLTARRDGEAWVLNGHKSLVAGAPESDRLIVSARTSGAPRDEAGITLFLIDRTAPGVTVDGNVLVDWSSAADVLLQDVRVGADAVIGTEGAGYALLSPAAEEAIIALCAEAVGALDGSIRTTAAYIAERKQFDVTLSSFQVLQHKMSDMAIELTMARSAVILGLQALAGSKGAERAARVSGCKAIVTGNLKAATAQGIQMHGGYGITEEYKVGHYFKRLLVIDAYFGRRAHHLANYAGWSLEQPA